MVSNDSSVNNLCEQKRPHGVDVKLLQKVVSVQVADILAFPGQNRVVDQ